MTGNYTRMSSISQHLPVVDKTEILHKCFPPIKNWVLRLDIKDKLQSCI